MPEQAGTDEAPAGPGWAGAVGHGLWRAKYLVLAGVALLLVAIPATEDLDALCRVLGIADLVVAALVVAATALAVRAGQRPARHQDAPAGPGHGR